MLVGVDGYILAGVGGGGYILAVGGCWSVVVDIFWLVVGGGGWWHNLTRGISLTRLLNGVIPAR